MWLWTKPGERAKGKLSRPLREPGMRLFKLWTLHEQEMELIRFCPQASFAEADSSGEMFESTESTDKIPEEVASAVLWPHFKPLWAVYLEM